MLCGREGAGRELGLVRERPRASASMERPPSVISVVWVCVCVSYTYRRGVSRRPHVCVHTRPATLQGPSQPASQPASQPVCRKGRRHGQNEITLNKYAQSVSQSVIQIQLVHSTPIRVCHCVHTCIQKHRCIPTTFSFSTTVLYDTTGALHRQFSHSKETRHRSCTVESPLRWVVRRRRRR